MEPVYVEKKLNAKSFLAGSMQNPYKERHNSCGGHLSMDISLPGIFFLISLIFTKYTQDNFDGIKAEVIISINMAIPPLKKYFLSC